MIENKIIKEEIKQWIENHGAAVAIYDAPLLRWNAPWRGEGAYLTNRFHPVRQQGGLDGVTQLRSSRASRSSSC